MEPVWAVFTLMLFVLEQLWLHSLFRARAIPDPVGAFALVTTPHRVLLTISVLTALAAAAGSYGCALG